VRAKGGEGEGVGGDLDFEGSAVRSSHAIELLSDIYALEGTDASKERARKCLTALGNKWDIIRKNYWDYKANKL
jgi:protein farnesyltransferase/geranylgeranyltransferase type-1 subunit alpha